MVGAITISMAYGIKIQPDNDPYIEIAEKALTGLAAGAQPGAFLVESFPILKHVPAWFPGAGFKRKARMWRAWTKKMVEAPFLAAQRQIVRLFPLPKRDEAERNELVGGRNCYRIFHLHVPQ